MLTRATVWIADANPDRRPHIAGRFTDLDRIGSVLEIKDEGLLRDYVDELVTTQFQGHALFPSLFLVCMEFQRATVEYVLHVLRDTKKLRRIPVIAYCEDIDEETATWLYDVGVRAVVTDYTSNDDLAVRLSAFWGATVRLPHPSMSLSYTPSSTVLWPPPRTDGGQH